MSINEKNMPIKSRRIFNIKSKEYSLVYKKLGEIIKLIQNEDKLQKRIELYSKIYSCVLENFDLLTYNKLMYRNSLSDFLNTMLYKGEESLNILNTYLEGGLKIKTYYKRLSKIYSIFEKKYLDYSLKTLIHTFPHIELLLEELKNKPVNTINECSICFENIKKKDCITTNCNHSFHKFCLAKSILERETCPNCRDII